MWLAACQVLRDTDNEEVHEIQRRGKLVDDRLTIPLMAEAIAAVEQAGKEVILDGYPRTVEQAEWVAENLANQVEAVVRIEVPKSELIQRLKLRGRADDEDESAIEERFRIVEQNIYTVCEILAGQGINILQIDGVGTMEEVTKRLHEVLMTGKQG